MIVCCWYFPIASYLITYLLVWHAVCSSLAADDSLSSNLMNLAERNNFKTYVLQKELFPKQWYLSACETVLSQLDIDLRRLEFGFPLFCIDNRISLSAFLPFFLDVEKLDESVDSASGGILVTVSLPWLLLLAWLPGPRNRMMDLGCTSKHFCEMIQN